MAGLALVLGDVAAVALGISLSELLIFIAIAVIVAAIATLIWYGMSAAVHGIKTAYAKSKSKHAKQRQGQRGISDDMIDQAIATGKKVRGNSRGTTKHIGRKIWVVTGSNGHVISVGWN